MSAATEHNATLAQVIADDAGCTCSGACANGTQPCTCGLAMPVPAGWAASAATEIGADDDYSLPRRADDISLEEFVCALAMFGLLLVCAVFLPELQDLARAWRLGK